MRRREFLIAGSLAAAGSRLIAAAPAPVRVGCQTNAWAIQDFKQFLDVVSNIRRLEFSCFETSFRNVQSAFSDAAARKQIEKSKVEFWAVHIFLDKGYDPNTAIPPIDMIETIAKGGAALGAKRLIVSGRSVAQGGKVDMTALRAKADGLEHAAELCARNKLRFAYHNHTLEFQNDEVEIEGLVRHTTAGVVYFVFDAGHAVLAGADPVRFFSRHPRRIAGIHLRDFRDRVQVPLGTGQVDYRPLAAAIKQAKWLGVALAEEDYANSKPGDSAIEPARRHLRSLFGI